MKIKGICILVLMLFGFTGVGCNTILPLTGTPIPVSVLATHSEQPDIRGKITDIMVTGGRINAIHIESTLKEDKKYDEAAARITEKTRVFKLVGESYTLCSVDQLVFGQTVEVLFTGIVREKYPPSAKAEEILIMQ